MLVKRLSHPDSDQLKKGLKTKQLDFCYEAEDLSLPVQEDFSGQTVWSVWRFTDPHEKHHLLSKNQASLH